MHTEIANSAYDFQQAVERGDIPVVGVNCYRMEEEECPLELFEVPETIQLQEKKLERIKSERSGADVRKVLDAVSRCCEEDGNLMEVIVDAVKAMATQGEISRAIKKSFGTWTPPLL